MVLDFTLVCYHIDVPIGSLINKAVPPPHGGGTFLYLYTAIYKRFDVFFLLEAYNGKYHTIDSCRNSIPCALLCYRIQIKLLFHSTSVPYTFSSAHYNHGCFFLFRMFFCIFYFSEHFNINICIFLLFR